MGWIHVKIQKVINQKESGFDQKNEDGNQKQMLHFDGKFGHTRVFWVN